MLYARAGIPRCPDHGTPLEAQNVSQMVDTVLALPQGTKIMLLAPVVQARKGEYKEKLDELKTQGFLRARIDGEVIELDDPPKLDKRKKHDIEVVIDRLAVKPDIELRLAESFETALNMADGVALVAFIDEPKKAPLAFSNKFACPICGYSIAELEPRLFSFNNPQGACPDCDGLGVRMFFDAARVVTHPNLSLAGGAIRGWDSNSTFYLTMISALAKHYKFDTSVPWEKLPEKVRNLVLYGNDGEKIQFKYENKKKGNKWAWKHAFEGIIPNMQRRYTETQSTAVREELAKYQSTQACATCGGTRLNAAARNVFVQERPLNEIASLSVTARARVLRRAELGRLARRDRRQDRQGDRATA